MPTVVNVAASDSTDTRWPNSNYGGCVDVYAPGVSITSSMANTPTTYLTATGTSMACPHVSGAAAQYLQLNPTALPQEVTHPSLPQCRLCCDSTSLPWMSC